MKSKRKKQKGFSLPMSLVFLLVAVMLSMVLVSAALTALTQVKRGKENRQASLTVTNTATVLAESISGMKFKKQDDPLNPISVENHNGHVELANYIADCIKEAQTVDYYIEPENLTLKETGSKPVAGKLRLNSMSSSEYPGDLIVSLSMDAPAGTNSADYKTAFRIDGWYDADNQEYCFGSITYYSGSGVYQ